MKKRTKAILGFLALLSTALCIVCCLLIIQYFRGGLLNGHVGGLNHSSSDKVVLVPIDELLHSSHGTAEDPKPIEHPEWFVNVDFDALSKVNPDIYAWIDIPGTGISYAVVQSPTDDLFYNSHSVDKTYYTGGSIYSQRHNSKTFQDPVTVLYGHNRKSKTMFAPVNDYAQQEFFDAHPYIYIYTPDRVYKYAIFAAYPHSSEHLLMCHDFSKEKEFTRFFKSLTDGIDTNYRRELFPATGDRVLTLSTCYRNNRMQRFLVQGVLCAEYKIEVQK